MPPTRREQLELDELLSDIYRGIEALPDKQQHNTASSSNHYLVGNNSPSSNKSPIYSHRSYSLKEYELPASSPLVKQHKQEIAALRSGANTTTTNTNTNKQPSRSTIKRHTNTPEQPAHSLASFVTSTTPENKRRVRIVEHPDKLAKGYSSNEEDFDAIKGGSKKSAHKKERVKYVNTNKLIYHQEREPVALGNDDDDDVNDDDDDDAVKSDIENNSQDDDIDGVTRVEYYHTNWLDRQLGRASKRRSSKELNERQVKEKAMIEELKRSLKNGAITLRQSLKGKRKNKPSETFDDQFLDLGNHNNNNNNNHHHHHKVKESNVFGSGLATIPRNYHHDNRNNFLRDHVDSNKSKSNNNRKEDHRRTKSYKETSSLLTNNNTSTTPKQTAGRLASDYMAPIKTTSSPGNQQTVASQQSTSYSSRTLPHNHQTKQHQLLQSHYKDNFNTLNPSRQISNNNNKQQQPHFETMNNCNINNNSNSLKLQQNHQQYNNAHPQTGNTISSIPSATEVVRSALSRSNSQISLNQLNKTINLIPDTPSPYAPSPMTPTQQLKAASPSLSPSPINSMTPNYHQHQNSTLTGHNSYCPTPKQPHTQYSSKTMGSQPNAHEHQHRLIGYRPRDPHHEQPPQAQPQQPVYANPHASLMRHKTEQQMQTSGKNTASIREFNELDTLLRSLSPNSSVQITPGFSSKPAQPSFGYGYKPTQQQQQPSQVKPNNSSDIYAKVQKQPTVDSLTIDVTNKKERDCLQHQELSEFEPTVEILPSMEDYQNITKLNPVKNHYWYKPNMSRDRAISLLKDKPQGTFIVRDSTSFKGAYGLAVKVAKLPKNVLRNPNADPSAELIRHFLIEPTANGVKLKGYANEPVFGSLPALIYQHSLTELALPCRLLIPRADIEDERFNHKQKQFFDEFASSKELAKHQPYERTSPDGGYRRYPGDVYINNEHRIIFQ